MKNLIFCVVLIASALWTVNVNGQSNIISHSTTACTSGDDILYNCGSVTVDLPTGENFIVNDGTTDLLTQKENGEFTQVNGSYELFNDDDHVSAGVTAISAAGSWLDAASDEKYFVGVADFGMLGGKAATTSYNNSTSNMVYAANATSDEANLTAENLVTGDQVQVEVNSTTVQVKGKDNSGSTIGFEVLSENGTELLQISNDGDFEANGSTVFNEGSGDFDFRIEGGTDVNAFFVDASADKVGIGTNAPSELLDVNGNARIRSVGSASSSNVPLYITNTGVLSTSSSDARLKTEITNLESVLDKVLQLEAKTYFWKGEDQRELKDIGFIAQEIDKIFPQVAFTNPADGYMGVNYPKLTPILAQAIKEQQAIIEEKDVRIETLENDVTDLNNRMAKLEALLLDGNTSPPSINQQSNSSKPNLLQEVGSLEQNVPNPFTDHTTISYSLGKEVIRAGVSIMSIDGKEMINRSLEVAEKGQVEIDMSNLSNGVYFYSLIVDGNIVATKPMVKM